MYKEKCKKKVATQTVTNNYLHKINHLLFTSYTQEIGESLNFNTSGIICLKGSSSKFTQKDGPIKSNFLIGFQIDCVNNKIEFSWFRIRKILWVLDHICTCILLVVIFCTCASISDLSFCRMGCLNTRAHMK